MPRILPLLILGALLQASCATAPPDAVELAFRRLDEVQRQFSNRDTDRLPPDYQDVVSLLPLGTWSILVDSHPDRAFERYAPVFEAGGDAAMIPRWALVRLARLGHRPTLDLFRGRLHHPDPYQKGLAIRMVAHACDGSDAARLLALLPPEVNDGDDSERVSDILSAVAGSRPSYTPGVDEALRRYGSRDIWGVIPEDLKARVAVTRAPDPAAVASRILFEERNEKQFLESFEEWLPEFAERHRITALAAVLRRRVDQEIRTYREERDEKDLRPAEPLLPQRDAFWGFRGPFLLAAYRRAILNLGVPLTGEEREWLESQRLLRPGREYLAEAGLLPP